MGKIIIFNDVKDRALDNNLENLVLFGEKDYIKDPDGSYDLIFHSRQILNPYETEKFCSLVMPVIRTFNEEKAIEDIYNINLKHPDFARFAVSGEFLDFYEVIAKDLGKEIKSLGKYSHVDEKKFLKHIGGFELARKINEKRRIIDNSYQAAS